MGINHPENIKYVLRKEDYGALINDQHQRAVVLLSGGIDSTVALFLARNKGLEVNGLEFFYDGRPKRESNKIEEICDGLGVKLFRVNYPQVIENSRNGLYEGPINLAESNFLYYSIAGGFAQGVGADCIIAGQILNDWVNSNDLRAMPDHYNKMNELLIREYSENGPKIITPFLYLNKNEVVKIGASLKTPFNLTWSCPNNDVNPCGVCPQCSEREEAFRVNSIYQDGR